MGIQAMVNDGMEGEEMTSPDEEDARMDGSEEDHDDEEEDEDEDDDIEHDNEHDHDQDDEEEEGDTHDDDMEEDHEGETNGLRANGIGHAHVNGYGDDVDMVEAHRAHTANSHGLVASA